MLADDQSKVAGKVRIAYSVRISPIIDEKIVYIIVRKPVRWEIIAFLTFLLYNNNNCFTSILFLFIYFFDFLVMVTTFFYHFGLVLWPLLGRTTTCNGFTISLLFPPGYQPNLKANWYNLRLVVFLPMGGNTEFLDVRSSGN